MKNRNLVRLYSINRLKSGVKSGVNYTLNLVGKKVLYVGFMVQILVQELAKRYPNSEVFILTVEGRHITHGHLVPIVEFSLCLAGQGFDVRIVGAE